MALVGIVVFLKVVKAAASLEVLIRTLGSAVWYRVGLFGLVGKELYWGGSFIFIYISK